MLTEISSFFSLEICTGQAVVWIPGISGIVASWIDSFLLDDIHLLCELSVIVK